MLLQFAVENFRSIRERAFLSLEPSKSDKEHSENLIEKNQHLGLKSIAIYGANASGKSNLLKALSAALIAVRTSASRQVTDSIPLMTPFKFNSDSAQKPCSFEFTFIADDGQKYVYGFSADSKKVHEEYLYYYTSAKASRIFDRYDDTLEFNKVDEKELRPLAERNTSNKLFISTATTWNCQKTKVPFEWLAKKIDVFSDLQPLEGYSIGIYAGDTENQMKQFTLHLLQQADVNIDGYSVEVHQSDLPPLNNPILSALIQNNVISGTSPKQIKINTEHTIEDTSGNKHKYFLDLRDESLGTQQLFMLGPILKTVFEQGKTIIIDEIDRSLHSFLVKYLIELFASKNNPHHAQLIFSTHDTNLLSLDIFRRDEIYFVEKNPKSAETSLYSLDEFSVRKSENIEKGYLLGRYGAIPFLHSEANLWA